MEYRRARPDGLTVSAVGYGTAPLGDMFGTTDEDAALQSAYRARDAGIQYATRPALPRRGRVETRPGWARPRRG